MMVRSQGDMVLSQPHLSHAFRNKESSLWKGGLKRTGVRVGVSHGSRCM